MTAHPEFVAALSEHRRRLATELAAVETLLDYYHPQSPTAPTPTTTYQDARAQRMMAVLQAPNNGHTKWIGPYIHHGYLRRSKTGVYTLTPKGRDKLAQLQA